MILLETLYDIKLENSFFYDRKMRITNKKTLLLGPKKSGKTHLIVDYLQNFDKDEYLYIDFNDTRVSFDDLEMQKLKNFIAKNHIRLLVLENFDFSFTLPDVQEIIISTDDKNIKLENFHRLYLYPLDFEEFIAFDKRHFNIEQLFSIFSKRGGIPEVVLYNERNYQGEFQRVSREFFDSKNEFLIFKKFCELQSSKASLFQIYNQLKGIMKISKDFLYNFAQRLSDRELILFLEKYRQKKAIKKIYIFDFAIKSGLTFKKDFLKRFENMIFLELFKREKDMYYTDRIDFFIPTKKLGIICSPFTPLNTLKEKMDRLTPHFKSLHIEKIEIITIGNEGNFELGNIKFKQISFWEWALGA
ncbi:MAG: ATP-binding protein [Sulfurospirillum sp.]